MKLLVVDQDGMSVEEVQDGHEISQELLQAYNEGKNTLARWNEQTQQFEVPVLDEQEVEDDTAEEHGIDPETEIIYIIYRVIRWEQLQ